MTNEELAIAAKSGDQAALAELWERNRALCIQLSRKYSGLCDLAGVGMEDLQQEVYFGFHAAVGAFDPAKGFRFSTYLTRHCWRVCEDALHIRNRRKLPPRPISLQIPTGEEDSDELQDLIPDEQPQRDIEERLYTEQLHIELFRSMKKLPEREAKILVANYFQNRTLHEIAVEIGCSTQRAHQLKRKALEALRKSPYLQGFVNENLRKP